MKHQTVESEGATVAPGKPAGAPIGLDMLVGPLLASSPRPNSALAIYLLSDGLAAGLAAQGRYFLALASLVVGRAAAIAWVAWSGRRASAQERQRGEVLHRLLGLAVYCIALAAIFVANSALPVAASLARFPSVQSLRGTTAQGIDQAVMFLTAQGDSVFRIITRTLLGLLTSLEALLTMTPWPVVFAVTGLLAWRRGGIGLLALAWVALGYLGLFGYWSEAIATSALVLASLCVCILIGIPTGILMAKNRLARAVVSPLLDLMQTMPSFVYLLPAVAFFSIGKPPALIATVIFAVPPLIRLTCLGIEQVPVYVKEAMLAHGARPLQTMLKAELPLALPSIRAGINQTIMMCLSMVVIAALIGGGGLGYNVLFALQNVQYGEGILAGLGIVFCAILFDRLVGKRETDRG
ncbi:ABC transporter permease subunit [Mesorhizobium sp. KR2-14]|uniref:ABC transporter permease n=1 Tax=Mesorhizobium sp. KR2-14 TaxID=3156610 RepID=UPI0032B5680B